MKHIFTITLFAIGIFFLLRSCAHAQPIPPEYEHLLAKRFKYENKTQAPSRAQKEKYKEQYDFHLFNGIRTYEDAKSKCWYLPNINDREKAKYCFTSAIATIGSSSPTAKLVVAISSLLTQYGIDCLSEWEYIENKLYWSNYHFEMCDHYYQLIYS